jgi:hypothetical protein
MIGTRSGAHETLALAGTAHASLATRFPALAPEFQGELLREEVVR